MKKERLDVILVQKGLVESRDKAKRTIMAGLVTVDGRVEDKAGQKFDPELEFAVKQKLCPYVSRGGLKLEKAMNCFPIDLKDGVCMDMGASTGGQTMCPDESNTFRTTGNMCFTEIKETSIDTKSTGSSIKSVSRYRMFVFSIFTTRGSTRSL